MSENISNSDNLDIRCPYFKDGRCHFALNGGFDFGDGVPCTAPFCALTNGR